MMVPTIELLLHFVLGPIGVIWALVGHGVATSLAEGALLTRWISGLVGTLTWHGVASVAL